MKNLILILLGLSGLSMSAQDNLQFARWMLANEAGLDFNFTSPQPLSSALDSGINLASATVSDADGNLLFYTDGITVFDRTHNIMPNGVGLLGSGGFYTQNVVIVPDPADINKYYIVYIGQDLFSSSSGLRYSQVDMTTGNGEVVSTTINTALQDDLNVAMDQNYDNPFGKLTTARHANGLDYWIVAEVGMEIFIFLVDHTGIQCIRRLDSPIAPNDYVFPNGTDPSSANGPMKMNFDCDRMLIGYATATGQISGNLLYLGIFDNLAGDITAFSVPLYVPAPEIQSFLAGAEFSESGQTIHRFYEKLMVSSQVGFDGFTLTELNIEEIDAPTARNPQRGIDGNIYFENTNIGGSQTGFIGVITDPDSIPYNVAFNAIDIRNTTLVMNNCIPPWVYSQNCLRFLTTSETIADLAEQERAVWISSSDTFDGTGARGIYHAGEFVDLTPGFDTRNGAEFSAFIEGCTAEFPFRTAQPAAVSTPSRPTLSLQQTLMIYPNPSKESITVQYGKEFNDLHIRTMEGKTVYHNAARSTKIDIDVSRFAEGIYLISVKTSDGEIITGKLVRN